MPLQSSGSISLTDIATEFGGSTPHALSEYYGSATGVPASGTIALSDFYGTSAGGSSSATATLTPSDDQSNAHHDRKGFGAQGKCDFYYPEAVSGTHDDAFGSLTNTTGLIPNCTVTSIAAVEVIVTNVATSGSHLLILQVQSSGATITQSAFSSIEFVGPTSSSSGNVTRTINTNAGSITFGQPYRLTNSDGVANMYEWVWFFGTFGGTTFNSGTTGIGDVFDMMDYGKTNSSTIGITIS